MEKRTSFRHHAAFEPRWFSLLTFLAIGLLQVTLLPCADRVAVADEPTDCPNWYWEVDASPILDPEKMFVGTGTGIKVAADSVLKVKEGDTLNLMGKAKDIDSFLFNDPYENCVNNPDESDGVRTIWSTTYTGGTDIFSDVAIADGEYQTLTAPDVPSGQSTLTFNVTVQADDKWDTGDGTEGSEEGNRNDSPGGSLTVRITVVKDCPTDITSSQVCDYPTPPTPPSRTWANFWSNTEPDNWLGLGNELESFGCSMFRLTIGPARTDGLNWNGMFIRETLSPDGFGPNTVLDDFAGSYIPHDGCEASSEGFITGSAPGGPPPERCPNAAGSVNDTFVDILLYGRTVPMLYPGAEDKIVYCKHFYSCAGTLLHVGGQQNKYYRDVRTCDSVNLGDDPPDAEFRTQIRVTREIAP